MTKEKAEEGLETLKNIMSDLQSDTSGTYEIGVILSVIAATLLDIAHSLNPGLNLKEKE